MFGLCSFNSGVDIYDIESPFNGSYPHLWCPTIEDIESIRDPINFNIDTISLMDYLDDGQCFETSGCIYLKIGGQIVTYYKKDLYKEATNALVDGVDQILLANGFTKMTTKHNACIAMVITNILFHAEVIDESIILPIFSEIDYLKHPDYEPDDILWKVKISTSSTLWNDAVCKIHNPHFQCIKPKYCYSYVCKKILIR